jgi:hypothetical protein
VPLITCVRPAECYGVTESVEYGFTSPTRRAGRLCYAFAHAAAQEAFFAQVGVTVAGPTTPGPRPDKVAETELRKRHESLP